MKPGHGAAALLRQRALERELRDPQPAVVGDVLAEGELAVELHLARDRAVARVLVDEAPRALLELGGVSLRPPVLQAAVRRELAALVVEAVGELVADHPAGGAVVDRVVRGEIEEGRLEDARREVDVVPQRVVVGVHGGRAHVPLPAVERLADLGELRSRAKALLRSEFPNASSRRTSSDE